LFFKENYAGIETPLPTLIKEKEPLWYQVQFLQKRKRKLKGIRSVTGLTIYFAPDD
jgi:hypothetical protein